MSLFNNPDELLLLQNLLNPQQGRDNSDLESDEECPLLQQRNNITPGTIARANSRKTHKLKNIAREPLPETVVEPLPKSIEEWQDQQEKIDAEALETRKCPEYTMTYRQAVGTEDVFLQMGNRSVGSASCEDLIMDISVPEELTSADKWNLSITEREVDLATPMYRLKVPLVHPVDVDRCKAKHDVDSRRLILTMRLNREFDFVNF